MDEQVIFILVPDKKWGNYIIQPCRATDKGEYYQFLGKNVENSRCDAAERVIVELCREVETDNLYLLFGQMKYKDENTFLKKADEPVMREVTAFISLKMAEVIGLLVMNNTPLFLFERRLPTLYKEEQIHLHFEKLKPFLGFYREEEHTRYTLRLLLNKEMMIPSLFNTRVITEIPGWVLLNNELYPLPDGFSAVRIKPFVTKEEVIISRHNEEEYFRKFIIKNLTSEYIEVNGFEVIEVDRPKSYPLLSMDRNNRNDLVLKVSFSYNGTVAEIDDPDPYVISLKEENGEYHFFKNIRNRRWERKKKELLLINGLYEESAGILRLIHTTGEEELIDWLILHKEKLEKEGFRIMQSEYGKNYYLGKCILKSGETENKEWFRLSVTALLENGVAIPIRNMRNHILEGNREYLLDNGSVFLIPREWFSLFSDLLLFGTAEQSSITLLRSQYPLLEKDKKHHFDFVQVETISLPEGLNAVLREYQLKGYEWLYHLYKNNLGACLADDMGLGKTVQAIAVLLKYREEIRLSGSEPAPTLILAPASVVHNWRNELGKFAPSLTVLVYTGTGREKKRDSLIHSDVIVTTYQTLRNDIELLAEYRFGYVVFDEAQVFKNRGSQVYRAVGRIAANYYLALSGTPIENSLSDLWSLMSVINPGLLGEHRIFRNYFINPITVDINGKKSQALQSLISPYILRRKKEMVLKELPERMDEVIYCDPDPDQLELYEEELSDARMLLTEAAETGNTIRNRMVILKTLNRLRQLANHPAMVIPEYKESSGKFKEVFRMLEEINGRGHKVLIFSSYVSLLNLVAEEMKQRQWKLVMLTGGTKNREETIERFSSNSDINFFLISLKAGGIGLNLTEADYVFILDPWWNIAAEEQAIGRAHRIGQKNAVFVYRFITLDTIEQKIQQLQSKKKLLADTIISNDENPLFTFDEIEELLL